MFFQGLSVYVKNKQWFKLKGLLHWKYTNKIDIYFKRCKFQGSRIC